MTTRALNGLTILVVEDEYFIADELKRSLASAGAQVVGPVGSVGDALDLLDGAAHLDFALLDLNLNGESALPIADRLLERNVFFAFVTGYGSGAIPARFGTMPCLEKPVEMWTITRAVQKGGKAPYRQPALPALR